MLLHARIDNGNLLFHDLSIRFLRQRSNKSRLGYVHRDVKPGNILVNKAGRVKITDFGISTSVDLNDVAKNNIVLEGVAKALARDLGFSNVSGTFPYMAPEMFEAIDRDGTIQVDTSVDIFALGMVFTFIS